MLRALFAVSLLMLAGCATVKPEIAGTPAKHWGIKVPLKAAPAPEPTITLTPAQETFAKRWLHKFFQERAK